METGEWKEKMKVQISEKKYAKEEIGEQLSKAAEELPAQNSKPGSLASKANLVSRYNSGQQTNQPKAEDESSSKEKKGKKK